MLQFKIIFLLIISLLTYTTFSTFLNDEVKYIIVTILQNKIITLSKGSTVPSLEGGK